MYTWKKKKKFLSNVKDCEGNEEFSDNLINLITADQDLLVIPLNDWFQRCAVCHRSESHGDFFSLGPAKLQLVSTLCGSEDTQTRWQNLLWYSDHWWVSGSRHPPTHARSSLDDVNPKSVCIRSGAPAPPLQPDREQSEASGKRRDYQPVTQILETLRSRRLSLICFYLWMQRYCWDGETSPGQWKLAIGLFGDESES